MLNGMGVLVAFCNSASQPVSAFRTSYNMMAQGATPSANTITSSNHLGEPHPSQP